MLGDDQFPKNKSHQMLLAYGSLTKHRSYHKAQLPEALGPL